MQVVITPINGNINPELLADIEREIGRRQSRRVGAEVSFLCPSHDDSHPSASWHTVKHVWTCHVCGAGGGAKHLATALGFDLDRYKPAKTQVGGKFPPAARRIVATYPYRDEAGVVLFESVRYEPKGFTQRQPDGQGGWIWDLKGVTRVLYHLTELIHADKALPVYIVEGEKDVDTLTALGLTATTNPQGAGKWRDEYSAFLAGRHVVTLADNDEPGRKHAEQVARAVAPVAASVKLVALPGLPEKGDVSDYLAAGHTVGELIALADDAPAWQAEPPPAAESDAPRETDVGNAERLVNLHGLRLRYCESFGWLAWDGVRWQKDAEAEIVRAAIDTAKSIFAEAAVARSDTRARELGEWALKSQSAGRVAAMIDLARSDIRVAVAPADFDADPWLLNCENGLLDLRTGTLGPHDRAALATKLCPVKYDPSARLDAWDKLLTDSTGADTELTSFLQRAAGYSISGSAAEEVILFVSGPQATGKSTFLEALKATLGDYATTADFEAFVKQHNSGGPRPDIARLAGARVVISIEVEDGKELAEALVKNITGGDTVTARELYKKGFEFVPQFTLWLAANHKPKVDSEDGAMWRRIRRVPFECVIPKEKRDPKVKAQLRDPKIGGPAVLAWAVAGCLAWQRDGLGVPPVVEKATEAYRQDMDPLKDFLAECCELKPQVATVSAALRSAYEGWAKESGDHDLLSGRAWSDRLRILGLKSGTMRQGKNVSRVWHGIRLLLAPEQESLEFGDESESVTACDDVTACNASNTKVRANSGIEETLPFQPLHAVTDPHAVTKEVAMPEVSDLSVEILTLARGRGWRPIVVGGRYVVGGSLDEWRDWIAAHGVKDCAEVLAALRAEVH